MLMPEPRSEGGKMGKKIFLAMFLCAFFLNAHAPKSLELSYDGEAAALSVKVLHKVSNPEKHFIAKISVYLADELLAEKTYERQDTAASQEEIFLFLEKPLKKGDAVTVTAVCSISGEKSKALTWD
jgi:desulfoferrodoxin (superoxide reductase-like protein)